MKARTFESPARNNNGAVGIPGRILKGIRISVHVEKHVSMKMSETSLHWSSSLPILGQVRGFTYQPLNYISVILLTSQSHQDGPAQEAFYLVISFCGSAILQALRALSIHPAVRKRTLRKSTPHLKPFDLERTQITALHIPLTSIHSCVYIQVKGRQGNTICAPGKRY